MNFEHPAWRDRPVRTAARVAKSVARRALPGLSHPLVAFDGGRSRILADLKTPLGLELYRYGGRHDADRDLLGLLLQPGDVCVDGGANVGLFTLVAAARVGAAGKVIAFEPAGATRATLRANVEVNRFDWVDVRGEALAAADGERELIVFGASGAGLSSFQPHTVMGGHAEHVSTVRLDNAIRVSERRRLRVVKLDLEGAEYEALHGAQELLAWPKPDLIVEVEPEHLARQGASAESLFALLGARGYEFYQAREVPGGVSLDRLHEPLKTRLSPNVFATTDVKRAAERGVKLSS